MVLTWEREARKRLTLAGARKNKKLERIATPTVRNDRFESAFEQELRALSSLRSLARCALSQEIK